ncbi:MAG: hypothetical protein Q4D32_09770 [Eubacteriales bacterium]|nr:hypothetical protein [Eubacteriales bacterium]
MYYSFVMGVDKSINELEKEGFEIEKLGSSYSVSFPEEKVSMWEEFIATHLGKDCWNEYLTRHGVVFLFQLADGIKRYELEDYESDEVLRLCEKLSQCKFESIKSMLLDNNFYKEIIESEEFGMEDFGLEIFGIDEDGVEYVEEDSWE